MHAYGKDATSAMLPITYINWFTGMGVIEYPAGRRRTILGLLYSCVVYSFYIMSALYSYLWEEESNDEPESRLSRVSDYVYYGSHVIIVGFIIAISIIFSKKRSRCVEELETINGIMKGMGIVRSYECYLVSQITKIGSLVVMMSLIGIVTHSASDLSIRLVRKSWIVLKIIFLQYPYYSSSVNEVLFCGFNDMMTTSFEDLNSLLESLRVKHPCGPHDRGNGVVLSDERKIEILYSVRQLYTRLTRVAKDWNQINAVFIFGTILFSTWIFAIHIFAMYIMLSIGGIQSIIEIYFIQLLLVIVFFCGKLFFIVHSGVSLTSEARRTCGIVLEHLHPIPSLRPEARTFSMQLIQSPLNLSILGLYSLDYSMLRQISGNVATYVITAIQTFHPELMPDLEQP